MPSSVRLGPTDRRVVHKEKHLAGKMIIQTSIVFLAVVAAASAQTRFEICSYANEDCTGAVRCGSDRDDSMSCASNGIPGVGVRATCADDMVSLFTNTDCSGDVVTQVVATGACVEFEVDGEIFYITNECTDGTETDAPTEAPTSTPTPVPTEVPEESSSPEASSAPEEESASSTPDGTEETSAPEETSGSEMTDGPESTSDAEESSDAEGSPDADEESSSPDSEEEDGEDDGSVCFDSLSTVLMEDGSRKTLSEVSTGDMVESVDRLGAKVFSEVFLIQHAGAKKSVRMVDIVTKSKKVRVTPTHYLRTADAKYVTAGSLEIGDIVMVASSDNMVEEEVVEIAPASGYPLNVHTMNDRIVVEGVVASCVSANPVLGLDTMQLRMLLAPLKLMHKVGLTGAAAQIDQAIHSAYNGVYSQ